jgi:NAD(P)-dependent dehydrogenase (short-subunit alcohol dehydrogenase family)
VSTSRTRSLVDGVLEASVVGSFSRLGPALRRRLEHWTPLEAMEGRTVLVTGATSGLGLAGAARLAQLGARVIGVGRSERALAELRGRLGERGEAWRCDLADLEQVDALAARAGELGGVDVVIHNAGALLAQFTTTPQGVETTLAVHLLAPYVLTTAWREWAQPPGRTILMTSGGLYTQRLELSRLEASAEHYRGATAYARAKRAQVTLVAAWQHRAKGDERYYAVHPGWAATPGVATALPRFDRLTGALLRTPAQGVDGALWLATRAEPAPGGGLWLDRAPRPAHRSSLTRRADDAGDEVALLAWLDERVSRARR